MFTMVLTGDCWTGSWYRGWITNFTGGSEISLFVLKLVIIHAVDRYLSLSLSLSRSLSLSLCFSLPPVLSLVESLSTPEHHHVTTLAPLMRGFCFQCIQLCTFATNIHTRLSFSRLLQLKNQMSLASSIVLVISSSQFFPILRICYLTVFAKNIIIKQCNEQLNYFPPNCVLQALD